VHYAVLLEVYICTLWGAFWVLLLTFQPENSHCICCWKIADKNTPVTCPASVKVNAPDDQLLQHLLV